MLEETRVHTVYVRLPISLRQEDKDDNVVNTGFNSLHRNKN